jgi:hypothetical protein
LGNENTRRAVLLQLYRSDVSKYSLVIYFWLPKSRLPARTIGFQIGYTLANPVEIAFSVSANTVTSSGGQLNQTSSSNNFPARGETFAQTV